MNALRRSIAVLFVVLALGLAACGGGAQEEPAAQPQPTAMMEEMEPTAAMEDMEPTEMAMEEPTDMPMEEPTAVGAVASVPRTVSETADSSLRKDGSDRKRSPPPTDYRAAGSFSVGPAGILAPLECDGGHTLPLGVPVVLTRTAAPRMGRASRRGLQAGTR